MPRGKSLKVKNLVIAAFEELERIQPASVRAVCYRLFTRSLIPEMGKNSTARVSRALVWAREQGVIPWDWVVDETREAERALTWADPLEYGRAVVKSYRRDRWQRQPRPVEVWSEKGTVRGTLAPVLDEYGVTFRVMHGFGSATAVHQIAAETASLDRPLLVLYVGDWDPSGLYMSNLDLPVRLSEYGAQVELRRVALTAFEIEYRGLPSFAASTKEKDSRYGWFVQHHGHQCWELDALDPVALRSQVEAAIADQIDWPAWEAFARVDRLELESLETVLAAWQPVL